LSGVAEPLGLAWHVENDQVVIGFREAAGSRLRRAIYQVRDLTGESPDNLARLTEVIQEFVAPDSWLDAGGEATIEAQGDALAIEQTEAAHFAILRLCEELRVGRGLSPRSSYPAAQFDAQAWQIEL